MTTKSVSGGRYLRSGLLSMTLFMLAVTGAASAGSAPGGIPPEHNYTLWCTGCHRPDGAGNPRGGIPDFRDSVGYFSMSADGRDYLVHVPGVMNAGLGPKETAEVLNYVINRWGGRSLPADYRPFTESEVRERQKVTIDDVVKLRRKLVRQLEEQGIRVADYPWP